MDGRIVVLLLDERGRDGERYRIGAVRTSLDVRRLQELWREWRDGDQGPDDSEFLDWLQDGGFAEPVETPEFAVLGTEPSSVPVAGPERAAETWEGQKVYSQSGDVCGVASGSVKQCSLDGCRGVRVHVRWPGGTFSWPCSKGMEQRGDGWQIL